LKQEVNIEQKITMQKPNNSHKNEVFKEKWPSKNQVRRITDFRCPSPEFPLSRIGEEKK
jgi:hypothetical protein